jgi:UrcA family protein
MDRNRSAIHKVRLTVLVSGLAIAAGAALAQPTEIITVEASRALTTPLPTSVATIKEVSLTGWVRIHDLDLTTSAGTSELAKRIDQTAKALCKEIDDKYPLIKSGDCVKDAVNSAMVEARKVIDARRAAATTVELPAPEPPR